MDTGHSKAFGLHQIQEGSIVAVCGDDIWRVIVSKQVRYGK